VDLNETVQAAEILGVSAFGIHSGDIQGPPVSVRMKKERKSTTVNCKKVKYSNFIGSGR
jgi:hypothetical protein